MSFEIKNKRFSETGKRFDMTVEVIPFINDDYNFRLRILSPEKIEEKHIKELVRQVIERKKEWCGKNCNPSEVRSRLSLDGVNANAYFNPVK